MSEVVIPLKNLQSDHIDTMNTKPQYILKHMKIQHNLISYRVGCIFLKYIYKKNMCM